MEKPALLGMSLAEATGNHLALGADKRYKTPRRLATGMTDPRRDGSRRRRLEQGQRHRNRDDVTEKKELGQEKMKGKRLPGRKKKSRKGNMTDGVGKHQPEPAKAELELPPARQGEDRRRRRIVKLDIRLGREKELSWPEPPEGWGRDPIQWGWGKA